MIVRVLGVLMCGVVGISTIGAADAPQAEPLLRDVRTGYLMHCTFRAIRPYIWKQTPLLTGWETDAGGGTWESSPSGFFPDSFAFHKDWFKLRDTSDQHAVTLRRRIARQTEGRITMEMRFMLPAALEGAAWQLRDLDDAAVALIVHDGKLCYATDGGPVPLVPLELNHEYGVRVDADFGRADRRDLCRWPAPNSRGSLPSSGQESGLRADHDRRARGRRHVPAARARVQGIRVCETFVTCAPGSVPSDWETQGPAARRNAALRVRAGHLQHAAGPGCCSGEDD